MQQNAILITPEIPLGCDPLDLQAQKLQALGQLTSGVAHDFNNLLTIILANLDMISARSDDQAISRLANNAIDATLRGTRLTQQLLAFSRAEKLRLIPVDLNHMIRSITDLLKASVGSGVKVIARLDADARPVMADPTQLELALLNLAINARDAMDGTGTLIIATAMDQIAANTISIGVSDNGSGMSPETLERATEAFFTTKEIGKGTGLGLAQVHATVIQLGGELSIVSELGKGTTVTMHLPCIAVDAG
jgi:signal transduction histidine kinase